MIKRGIILLYIALAMAPLVSGLTLLSTGKYASGGNFTVENVSYQISFNKWDDSVLIESESMGMSVRNTSCEFYGNLKFCLDSIYFRYPDKTHNYTYEAFLSVYKKERALLSIEKSIGDSTLLKGQETEVRVTIKNGGEIEATNLEFSDFYPAGITLITNFEGCSITGNSYVWKGSLKPNEEHTCKHSIKAESALDNASSIAKVDYFDGEESKIESLETPIQVYGKSLEIVYNTRNRTLWIGEENRIEINLSNLNTEHSIEGELDITFPKGTRFIRHSPLLEIKQLDVKRRVSLGVDESENLYIDFISQNSGNQSILISHNVRINGISEELSERLLVIVRAPKPEVIFTGKGSASQNERTSFSVWLSNPSGYILKDVEISTQTDIPGVMEIASTYNQIGSKKQLIEEVTSDSLMQGVYKYSIEVGYNTEYNEKLSEVYTHQINVGGVVAEEEEGESGVSEDGSDEEESSTEETVRTEASEEAIPGSSPKIAKEGILESFGDEEGFFPGFSGRRIVFVAINIMLIVFIVFMGIYIIEMKRKQQQPRFSNK